MVEPDNGIVKQYGSHNGCKFLSQNDAISLKFAEFFGTV
jgi:hypothetical protein